MIRVAIITQYGCRKYENNLFARKTNYPFLMLSISSKWIGIGLSVVWVMHLKCLSKGFVAVFGGIQIWDPGNKDPAKLFTDSEQYKEWIVQIISVY